MGEALVRHFLAVHPLDEAADCPQCVACDNPLIQEAVKDGRARKREEAYDRPGGGSVWAV